MPESVCSCAAVRPSAAVNAAIADLCRATAGGWTRETLAELAALRAEWRDAVARETALAA